MGKLFHPTLCWARDYLSIILAKGTPGFCCEQSGENWLCFDKAKLHLIFWYADWCDFGITGIWGVAAHQGYD